MQPRKESWRRRPGNFSVVDWTLAVVNPCNNGLAYATSSTHSPKFDNTSNSYYYFFAYTLLLLTVELVFAISFTSVLDVANKTKK